MGTNPIGNRNMNARVFKERNIETWTVDFAAVKRKHSYEVVQTFETQAWVKTSTFFDNWKQQI